MQQTKNNVKIAVDFKYFGCEKVMTDSILALDANKYKHLCIRSGLRQNPRIRWKSFTQVLTVNLSMNDFTSIH